MKKIMISVVALALSGLAVFIFWPQKSTQTAQNEPTPLYWVAPMDPHFKQDKPGKSPMGMDLIPVYASQENSPDNSVKISPEVINNLSVRTANVTRESLDIPIQTFGYVAYDEDTLFHIHPRIEGWVEKLYVKATGEPVKKGAPLYDLYAPQLVNAQGEYLIALKGRDKHYILAAENRLHALHFTDAAIEALKKSRTIKQRVTFYSPKSGVVENLSIRQGFFVTPETTMISIGSLNQVWVDAEVIESQAKYLKKGLAATITIESAGDKKLQSHIDYIYPTLNPATRTVKVRFRLDNPHHTLKPNMFAHMTLHTQPHSNVLVIPKEAVIREGNQNRVVLALGKGRFMSTVVKTGLISDTHIQIVKGLKEGQKVVTSAQFLIDSESNRKAGLQRLESTTKTGAHHRDSMDQGSHTMDNMDHSIHAMDHREKSMNHDRQQMDHGSHNRESDHD